MDFSHQRPAERQNWGSVLVWNRVCPTALLWISLGLIVYCLQLVVGEALTGELALSREAITGGKIWSFFTHLFSAKPQFLFVLFFHLVCIGTVGSLLEREIGPRGFITILLTGGLFGALAHLAFRQGPFLGMHASVSAVVAATLVIHPRSLLDFKVIPPMPSWVFGVIYLSVSLCYMLMEPAEHLPGLEMHLAGAAAGVWLAANAVIPSDPTLGDLFFSDPDPYFERPEESPQYEASFVAASPPNASEAGSEKREEDSGPSEAEVDRVLDKLSAVGLANLAAHEREVLEKAAERKRS